MLRYPCTSARQLRESLRSLAPASSHYLDRDEHKAIGDLWRANAAKGIEFGYVFVNERDQPFGRMGVGRIIERAGEAAGLGMRFREL